MVVILEFKKFLKGNKNSRKIFGKKELEIIFRQLDGFPLMQSEKNRLSRDIKPKLRFISEINKFKDEFELKKNQDNKKIIEHAVAVLLEDKLKNNINSILLFGSFADKSFTKRSDIDICVVFKKKISLKEATQFRIRIAAQVPKKLDIQVFNVLPQKIKREIARNHKILFKHKDYDDINFSIRYLKDQDYFIRRDKILEAEA